MPNGERFTLRPPQENPIARAFFNLVDLLPQSIQRAAIGEVAPFTFPEQATRPEEIRPFGVGRMIEGVPAREAPLETPQRPLPKTGLQEPVGGIFGRTPTPDPEGIIQQLMRPQETTFPPPEPLEVVRQQAAEQLAAKDVEEEPEAEEEKKGLTDQQKRSLAQLAAGIAATGIGLGVPGALPGAAGFVQGLATERGNLNLVDKETGELIAQVPIGGADVTRTVGKEDAADIENALEKLFGATPTTQVGEETEKVVEKFTKDQQQLIAENVAAFPDRTEDEVIQALRARDLL